MTYRETLEGLLERCKRPKRRAELEAELALPPYPYELSYLLYVYTRLRKRKAGNGYGPNPIEWPDIAGFEQKSRLTFSPWETEIIEDLDDLWLASRSPSESDKPTGED